ncbi:Senescence-specific cysteine protease SAG12 [Abeliophyllum distichum]|uniref:Senescence-specific cysteine protease SAG12 n=1 Tax=Abeliophyllum distichum TaxID=126358 RepID=A0ABD1SF91_9LAMI
MALQVTTESNYPYEGTDGKCNSQKKASHAAKITGYKDVPANSESALLKAVAKQPVSVAIDASGSDFQFYSSGVFIGECGTDLDLVLHHLVMGQLVKVWVHLEPDEMKELKLMKKTNTQCLANLLSEMEKFATR